MWRVAARARGGRVNVLTVALTVALTIALTVVLTAHAVLLQLHICRGNAMSAEAMLPA